MTTSSVLDSTVATGDAEFDLENKIVEVLFMPEETGGGNRPTLGALTDDDAIFHSPKILILGFEFAVRLGSRKR